MPRPRLRCSMAGWFASRRAFRPVEGGSNKGTNLRTAQAEKGSNLSRFEDVAGPDSAVAVVVQKPVWVPVASRVAPVDSVKRLAFSSIGESER